MTKSNSLKRRIITTTVIIVTLTSILLGAGLLLIKQKLEEATFGRMVQEQLQTILSLPPREWSHFNPLFRDWQFYQGSDVQTLPEKVKELPPGSYHSFKVEDNYYQVEVVDLDGRPVFLLYDLTAWEEQEHELLQILVLCLVVVLFAGVFMGARSSKIILAPIRRLTASVSGIQPGERNIRIGSDFEGSEIGEIAEAVDGYLERLDQFVEREQSFSAAASHELRTPLSVIMGAVDILDANRQSGISERAVNRIKRACADMHAFIEATLFLSREGDNSISQEAQADIPQIIEELVADNRLRIEQEGITLEVVVENPLQVNQPRSILQMTIGNILRNAIEHSAEQNISIHLKHRTLTVSDTGEGIPAEQLPHIFDAAFTTKPGGTGLGLNLVKRVCDRFHWHLEVKSELSKGTSVQICFQADG